MQGTTPTWLTVRGRTLAQGRFIDNQDVTDHAAVAVLGATTASELFSRRDPVGQTVDVNGVPLTVVGVLTSTGRPRPRRRTSDPDDPAVIPITTGAERIFGGTSRNSVSSIAVQARSSADLTAAYQEADHLLLQLHGITDAGRRRLHDHLGAVADLHRHLGRPHADHPARWHRRHLAARRRHRRHEHHAGLGHRAHPRDRAAQGARGHAAGDPAPVPGRGVRARPDRRRARRALARASSARTFLPGRGRRPDHHQPDGHGRRTRRRPGHRHRSSASTRPAGPRTWPPSTLSATNSNDCTCQTTATTRTKRERISTCRH